MNILIYGIGGVGGYFGAKLATTDHHVSFVARGEHLKAIQKQGITVKSFQGDFNVKPDLATEDLREIPTPDLVIFGVKSWQLPKAAEAIKPFINTGTLFLPLQNGASNPQKLMQFLPKDQILSGLCNIISFKESPGVIRHFAVDPTLTFGELDNKQTKRILNIQDIFIEAGINGILAKDIHREVWKKFMFICTISGIGGLTRVPIGEIRKSTYLYDMMLQTAYEILKIAQTKKIDLNEEDVKNVFEIIDHQDPKSTASTQRDIMEGKPSELENFNGYIVQEGKKLGVATPINEMIYECLLPMEQKARS
ncbi:2-dehydropantoate 2-reductase [Galbibacter sp. BG1]|uniref:ketopantoate reductase family protein n=1 Tax=Galbibacter sp. BG1 TaxID=1170699 RepID=UPI0015BFF820|nr:2-dehydropantoate 2-reductase [Galbibacter sp. BG1]QLE02499.1 2-dehydropantoate 2-reductase [Galbibacter sp. BG1]